MDGKNGPIFINESMVKSVLTWPLVNEAVEEALRSASNLEPMDSQPYSNQPARSATFTENRNGVLFCMPGYVGNYCLGSKKYNTLASKLVTGFKSNVKLENPLPNILANILLFNSSTGQLQCVMEGTEITTWRTASASIISTKYLYFKQDSTNNSGKVLSIIGCGVQGRIHAIGMCSSYNISEIRLWNRSPEKAIALSKEIDSLKEHFPNTNMNVLVSHAVQDCVANADIIITATFAPEPVLHLHMLKPNVHINAIGAGVNHHSELSEEIYQKGQVYIDNWASAKTELKNLKADILGEVGEVINGTKAHPTGGITIFQSMGMASEDATVAQAVYEALKEKKNDQ